MLPPVVPPKALQILLSCLPLLIIFSQAPKSIPPSLYIDSQTLDISTCPLFIKSPIAVPATPDWFNIWFNMSLTSLLTFISKPATLTLILPVLASSSIILADKAPVPITFSKLVPDTLPLLLNSPKVVPAYLPVWPLTISSQVISPDLFEESVDLTLTPKAFDTLSTIWSADRPVLDWASFVLMFNPFS